MSRAGMVAVALAIGLAATSAKANTVVDLNDIDLGNLVAGPETDDLHTVGIPGFSTSDDVGDITSRVYQSDGFNNNVSVNNINGDGAYTYTYEVSPTGLNYLSEFNTGFAPLGFNGVHGWDFDEAMAAGGSGDEFDFSTVVDPDGTIEWNVAAEPSFWNTNETITFFYQSDLGPGQDDVFNVINHRSASGLGIVPVPEPASASLLGVLGLAMLRRRPGRRG